MKTHTSKRMLGETILDVKTVITDRAMMDKIFHAGLFDIVVNLATQPRVRYVLLNPYFNIDKNVVEFANMLEGCRHNKVKHLDFAVSSSIYSTNASIMFSVNDNRKKGAL